MFGKHSKLFFLVSMVVLVVAIVLAAWGFQKIVDKQIQKNVQLENNSLMFDKWQKLPMPLDFKVYLFNVSNVDEVNRGKKPILNEIGPYVYKQYREKTILGYGPNDTIKYMLRKRFEFDPVASGDLTEDDEVTVIHFSYLAALLTIHDMMPSLVGVINKALEQFFPNLEDGFLRVRVRDLLFDGIYLSCDGDNAALGLVCGKIKTETPPTMRASETSNGFYFSMFSHMNRSESGPWEMKRGRENVYDLGNVVSYKGKEVMPMWGDKYCGKINGSDSSIFPPINPNNVPKKLYTFEPDICRSVYVDLVGKSELFNISSYYYEISPLVFGAKSANPDNKCFCRKNWSANHDGCLLMGLLNLMPCQGAPAIASLPHFYLGSEELLEFFQAGIKPDKEKHNTFVHIDPITGVVLSGVKRLQFNIELRKIENIPQLSNVPTGLFPMLWLEEGASIPESIQQELKDSHKLLSYVQVARWMFLALAVVAVVVSAVAVARSNALIPWPRNSNSVSFILGHNVAANKGH
ncbi:sensory neuron membrane protein 2-like [Trichoplusia ni]|uniref:Sensory neuron membrane protein 2-like n=1 Tax=Trichoplusia ni TaxID=7111 RepID=A0A7E5WXA9_TRINI|nr:sensory neuron membrane protein 2-like [Trichoplusia ni]